MNMKALMDKASDLKNANSYKFYVPTSLRDTPLAIEDSVYEAPPPRLLLGEIIITAAHRVVLYPSVISKKKEEKGCIGNLFVTNFRVVFVPCDEVCLKGPPRQKNLLMTEYGICLTNIESLFEVNGDKIRKLPLSAAGAGTDRIKYLQLICKNFRVLNFSFEQSPYDHGKNIAKTVLHHAFPGRHPLLFAYEYSEPETADDIVEDVTTYTAKEDWLDELVRTCPAYANQWRISPLNENFALSPCLPTWILVPKSVLDYDLAIISNSFRTNRPPTWSWSTSGGAALVRMADVLPAITERTQENRILENIRRSHPTAKAPVIIELDKHLPSIRDINSSFNKLRELCTPASKRNLKAQDNKFYLLLDSSKWLSYVSVCLREAAKAVEFLKEQTTVVLQESDGRDTSALISSLVQLMMDPTCRSVRGFQSLIQKEWVALGHPFCTRLGHVQGSTSDQSPVFLLFLDCVWQLQNQFSTQFEFSETYLTSLFDSCFVSVFDTFLFDCERDRRVALKEDFRKRSVWNWRKQFSDGDIALFANPLYRLHELLQKHVKQYGKVPPSPNVLIVNPSISVLEPWAQCYFRWLPGLGIRGGGRPQVYAVHKLLRASVDSSLAILNEHSKIGVAVEVDRGGADHSPRLSFGADLKRTNSISTDSLLDSRDVIDNFYPFTCFASSSSNLLADESTFSEYDTQSVLNLTD